MEKKINSTPFPGGKWQPGDPAYKYVVKKDVDIKMSDGVKLKADVAYPADKDSGDIADGKFPVVVEMTPYVTLGSPVNVMTYFAGHGYISVVIRLRGTGKSEGDVNLYADRDAEDSRNVIDWAANMEHSDGRIAFVGCSFPAGMALLAESSCDKDSPLKCIVACNNALESVYRECWLCGGTPTAGFANYSNAGRILYGNSPATNRFFDRMSQSIMSGGEIAYDNDFWAQRMPMEFAKKIVENNVPTLLWTGFYDILDIPAYKTYIALQNAYAGRDVWAPMEIGQRTSPRFQMVAGGWHHADDLNLGIYLEWIETWLKGTDTGLQTTDKPLHLYEGGSKRWYNTASFHPNVKQTELYLESEDKLSANNTKESTSTLVWGWPDDKNSLLTYTIKALDNDLIISGPMFLNLQASSSAV